MMRSSVWRRWLALGAVAALGSTWYFLHAWLPPSRQAASAREAVEVVWCFEPAERGAMISSPVVTGDRVYVAAIRDLGLTTGGVIYCLDRETRRVLWQFDDDGQMQHMYSTPCVAFGRLYVGEGMHANHFCK